MGTILWGLSSRKVFSSAPHLSASPWLTLLGLLEADRWPAPGGTRPADRRGRPVRGGRGRPRRRPFPSPSSASAARGGTTARLGCGPSPSPRAVPPVPAPPYFVA